MRGVAILPDAVIVARVSGTGATPLSPPGAAAPGPRLRVMVVVAAIVGALALLFPLSSLGASFASSCASDLDVATCERMDYVAQAQEDEHRLLGWIAGISLFLVVLPIFHRTFNA
jgi:hypothetical protein